jgi:hypothetical protein
MLRQMLNAFVEMKVLSTSSLAQKTGVPESMVIHLLEELVRLGYLQENVECTLSCAGCDLQSKCKSDNANPQRLWTLSPKGQKSIIDA